MARLAAAALGLSLATGVAGASSAAEPAGDLLRQPGNRFITCETARLDVGTPQARPALVSGFYADSARRLGGHRFRTTCARPRASVRIDLLDPSDRSLAVRAMTKAEGQSVELWWNDVPLGARKLPRRWQTTTWELPAGAVIAGPNTLRIEAARSTRKGENDRRPVGLCIDTIEISPATCLDPAAPPSPAGPGVELPPGVALELPVEPIPDRSVWLTARSEAGAVLDLVTVTAGAHERAARLELAPGRARRAQIRLPGCCSDLSLVAQARGGGPVQLISAELTGDRRVASFRRDCGIRGAAAALGIGLLGLALLPLWRPLRLPRAGRWTPLLDLLLVAGVAVVARAAYLDFHGPIDTLRFPDAREYLKRASALASGDLSFWGHTQWHRWQSWIRPPGFYVLLAFCPLQSLGRLQAGLSVLTALGTYGIARPLFGRGAGLFAGLAFALYPEAVMTATWVMSEPLFLSLLVPALAALAHASVRPRVGWAVLAGVLFGLSALVRSAPLYFVPTAAALLLAVHGWRPARKAAAALVLAFAVVVLPWSVRNSILYGRPMAIDDVAIPNHLRDHPNQRFIPHLDLDLDTPAGRSRYWWRVKNSNRNHRLTRQGGVLSAGLWRQLADPATSLPQMMRTARTFWSPTPDYVVRRRLREKRPCRIRAFADTINAAYFFILILGAGGFVLTIRDRRTWPIALWLVFLPGVTIVLFYALASGRYRLPVLPVLMVYAGACWVRLQDLLAEAGAARRRGGTTPSPET